MTWGDYHHQNLTDGKLPLWRHGRAWWWKLAWEWSVFMRPQFGFSAGRGGLSLHMLLFSVYVSGRNSEGLGARWSIDWRDGGISIGTPWERQWDWRASDPWWRRGIRLPLVDWVLGRTRCETTKGKRFEVIVPMPEGSYVAKARPESRVWRRRFGIIVARRDEVWLDIDGGIPHAGKGSASYNCGDDGLCGTGGKTVEEAIASAVSTVLERRRRYGYDSEGTGKEPLRVMNASASEAVSA